MKKKLGLLFLVAVVAIASVGMSYSLANGDFTPLGTPNCYCDVAFVGTVTARDNEVEKFIGEVDASLVDVDDDGLYDKVWVEIDHAYPGYVVYIDFTVENKGNRPVNVNGLIPISYDAAAMSFGLDGDITLMSFPWWLEVGSSVNGTLVITVENGAFQNEEYEFTVGLGFSNLECPQPVLLETLTVPSDGSSLWSTVLQDGNTYLLKALGTYTYWPAQLPEAGMADAKYSLRPQGSYNTGPGPQWIDGAALPSPYTNYLQIWIDGAPMFWGGDFNGDHIYTMHYPGAGSSISFSIMDNNYGDNSGSLTVQIYGLT